MNSKTLFLILVFIGIALVFLSFAFGYKYSWSAQKELSLEINNLTKQADSLQNELKVRKDTIKILLDNDSFYIEELARTKFGMTKKNEKGFYFIP